MMQKNSVKVNFASGVDTKTDSKQLQIGQFTALQNSVFDTGGRLTKRNGFKRIGTLADSTYINTYNENLIGLNQTIEAYSNPVGSFVPKGRYEPLSLSTLPVVRNNINQIIADTAVAPNGMACCAYSEFDGVAPVNKYVLFDSVTGQNVIAPTLVPLFGGSTENITLGSRVYSLGIYFVIITTYDAGGGDYHLQYVAIDSTVPTSVDGPNNLSASYTASTYTAWDAAVNTGGNLYFAYMSTSSGLVVNYLTPSLTLGSGYSFSGASGQSVNVCIDETLSTPIVYANWYNGSTHTLIASVDVFLTPTSATGPSVVRTLSAIANIAAAAQSGVCTVFYELTSQYGYDSTIPNNSIFGATSVAGTTTSTFTSINGAGLASKAFIYKSHIYYLAAYQSSYQPTYFLINGTSSTAAVPVIAAKLAYGNGGGYLTRILPNVPLSTGYIFTYLFKDLLQSVNKNTNVPSGTQVDGIYTQTGINIATVVFGTSNTTVEEIGNDLHMSGGFLWMYDGYVPVEHNFFLWPDSIEASYNVSSIVSPTGSFSSGSTTITVSSASGIAVGMAAEDSTNSSYIPAGALVAAINGTTITINLATTHSASGDTLHFFGQIAAQPDGSTNTDAYYYQVTYEWSDNQGNIFRSAPSIPVAVTTSGSASLGTMTINIPTLRATLKTANPVKIVVYRWSVAQQEYYQVTSLDSPLLNDPTVQYLTYTDASSDDTILGNNLLYTTGGVVEDVNASASNLFTLFDTRLWLVDAEDPNKVWYSKQVIEATPVEMSDLFTMYIPPSVGTSLNTGPITAISTMDDKLMMAKATSWVYVNGSGPDNTGANSQYSQPIFVTSTVGCSNQASIVLSPNGLMFQSPSKGIWLIGRDLQTSYIGAAVEQYTASAKVNSAELMQGTTQVRFTLDSGITLMYDYYYGQWATFNTSATSSCVFQGLHTYIDSAGGVWQENPGSYVDGSTPVVMSFTTGPIRLGDLDNYQRMYFFYLLGTYYSPHYLTMALTYDYGASPSQTIVIEPGSQVGITSGSLEAWRIFPMTQRCRAISLTMTESYDSTLGPAAGQGLTLSGMNFVCGFKKGFVPTSSANSAG